MLELREGSCFSKALVGANVGLACVDGVLSVLALIQLMRIHSRNVHIGWTRQKVFHLLIALSNLGFFFYFVLSPVAVCEGWFCWQQSCGFVAMACPKILFLTVFLLLLSFWVDLCHQSNDDDDYDDDGYSSWESLLEENKLHSNVDTHRNCCFYRASHIESRQKVAILVTALVFVLMLAAAMLIWIGKGKSPIDSSVVARAYVDLFAILVLLLVAALAYYGLVLFLKMSRVRSERASSEMWKVAGLAIVSVLCFTSSSFISVFTDVPLLYNWSEQNIDAVSTSLLLVLYYFVGSSIPSAFVLWVMRDLQPVVTQTQQEPSTIAFITDTTSTSNPQRWTTVATLQNQVLKASPI